ncbi:hypothetical protein [Shivajiella indica]|uniref:DUF1611 domain-containing protein n=1 Tax=Shivajiella indica TaxID=872115 RepID=A0ABW5B8U6_9BACT
MKTRIKKSFACQGIKNFRISTDIKQLDNYIPKEGDVVLFEVIETGKHKNLQTTTRNVTLMPEDQILGVFGNRYATNQFEGYVPDRPMEEYHMLGGGGVMGILASSHSKFEEVGPTRLKLIGLATDPFKRVINTLKVFKDELVPFSGLSASQTKIVLSLGSSMDSGKTTTAAFMIHGLKKRGNKVAYIKLTGTAYPKDKNLAYDMGADLAIDFSKYGFPSTYLTEEPVLLSLYETLIKDSLSVRPDYVVIEIADGIFQKETKMLLQNFAFMNTVNDVVFSAGDSLSAVHGYHLLCQMGIFPTALSGLFTASPLLVQEVESTLYKDSGSPSVPVLGLRDLMSENCPIFSNTMKVLQA